MNEEVVGSAPLTPTARAVFQECVRLAEANRFQEALPLSKHLLHLAPDNADSWTVRATVLLGVDRPRGAIRAAEHGLALPPNGDWSRALLWLLLAEALIRLRRYDEARTALYAALRIRTDQGGIELEALLMNAAEHYDVAYGLLRAVSPIVTWRSRGWYQYLVACAGLDNLEELDVARLEAARLDSSVGEQGDHVSYVLLGRAQWQVHYYAQALAAFERAVQLEPDSFAAWSSILSLLQREHRFREVLSLLPKVFHAARAARRRGWTPVKLPTLLDRIKRL